MNPTLTIIYYEDTRHHEAFKSLNERWITELFEVEKEDLEQLDHPVENILQPGGFILMAELDGKAVGSFAAIPCHIPKYEWELVKFAVNPSAQGHNIGSKLIEACLERLKTLNAKSIYIESNQRCEAAVHLYEKYGFMHIPNMPSEYDRADVFMEKVL